MSPNGNDVENVQVLAFVDAADSFSAMLEFKELYSQATEKLFPRRLILSNSLFVVRFL